MLAAAYAFGLVKNHPYRDGNKRIGFLAMATFLGLNGHVWRRAMLKWSQRYSRWPMEQSPRRRLPIGFATIV